MSGFEVPMAIAGFIVGLLLRAGREKEAELRGIAIGRRLTWRSRVGRAEDCICGGTYTCAYAESPCGACNRSTHCLRFGTARPSR